MSMSAYEQQNPRFRTSFVDRQGESNNIYCNLVSCATSIRISGTFPMSTVGYIPTVENSLRVTRSRSGDLLLVERTAPRSMVKRHLRLTNVMDKSPACDILSINDVGNAAYSLYVKAVQKKAPKDLSSTAHHPLINGSDMSRIIGGCLKWPKRVIMNLHRNTPHSKHRQRSKCQINILTNDLTMAFTAKKKKQD